MQKIIFIRRMYGFALLTFLGMIFYPLYVQWYDENITQPPRRARYEEKRKQISFLEEQEQNAVSRHDDAAQEEALRQLVALREPHSHHFRLESALWGLAALQEQRGEYAQALVTTRSVFETEREVGFLQWINYARLCDKAGDEAESKQAWQRVINKLNANGLLGDGYPVLAGHTLTHQQIGVLAESADTLANGKLSQERAAARAALKAVPQCDAARNWLAESEFRDSYTQRRNDSRLKDAAENYAQLAHLSDAGLRDHARKRLRAIADFRAAIAGRGLPFAKLDATYMRERLVQNEYGNIGEEVSFP